MKKIIILIVLILIAGILFFINFNTTSSDNTTTPQDWKYDKNEYPKDEHSLEELPVSHKSAYEVRKFFEDSDSNHDGILKGQEISTFDYKIKHSQYTFNGPYGYN